MSSRWQWVGRTGEPEHKTRDSGGPCFRKRGVCHTAGLLFLFSITSLDFECFVCVVVLVQDKVARNMAQGTLAPTLPSEAEAIIARESSRVLASHAQNAEPLRLRMVDGPGRQTVKIPASAVQMLIHILEEMARGNAVTLIPVRTELTTQEAADMLNISRPSLIQLLDEGKIEFRRVGTHRRVRFEGLMAYKRRADADRRAALAELAAYDQEIGL